MVWVAIAFVCLGVTGAWWLRVCVAPPDPSVMRDVLRLMRPGLAFVLAGGAALLLSQDATGAGSDALEAVSNIAFGSFMLVGFWKYGKTVRATGTP